MPKLFILGTRTFSGFEKSESCEVVMKVNSYLVASINLRFSEELRIIRGHTLLLI